MISRARRPVLLLLAAALAPAALPASADDHACRTLARIGSRSDLPVIKPPLDEANRDLRSTVANAIPRIGRRSPHCLAMVDWAVIGIYALGMLSIGW
jgi:hypothetical protein